MQESGLIEFMPLMCTSALWGQYPVLSHPEFSLGAPLQVQPICLCPEFPQGSLSGAAWWQCPLFTDMTNSIFYSKLPDISLGKMDLFGISRRLQLGVGYMVSHVQVAACQQRRTLLQRGKGSWEGYHKQRVHGFSLAESLPGKKRSLPSCWALLALQGMRAPPSGRPALLLRFLFICLQELM